MTVSIDSDCVHRQSGVTASERQNLLRFNVFLLPLSQYLILFNSQFTTNLVLALIMFNTFLLLYLLPFNSSVNKYL